MSTTLAQIENILISIAKQAPVARIQAKRSFLETILPELDRALVYEKEFAHGVLATGDWKKALLGETNFISAKQMAEVLSDSKVGENKQREARAN